MCFAGCPDTPSDAAAWHAARGRPVFPCDPRTKAPLVREGFHAATLDPVQIREWWVRWPNAMIGCPTNEVSGLHVIDIDRKGGDPDEILDELSRKYDLPQTLLVATAGGGYHLYFHAHPGVRRAIRAIHPAVDTLGEGGFVILPPSRTVDGRQYRLVHDADPIDMPDDLLAACMSGQRERPALTAIEGGVAQLPYYAEDLALWRSLDEPGRWHESQRSLVARYVTRGIDATTITAMAPAFRRDPYSLDQTIREIGLSARGAATKFTPPKTAERLQQDLLSLDELELQEPPEFLVGGLIPERALGYIYGDSNTFKTFVALDLALSVAYGVPWQGRPVKQASVVYILGEGQGSFAKRVRVWRAARGLAETPAPFYALLHPVYLTDPQEVPRLVAVVEAKGVAPALVVLDTIARNFGPGDPDKTQDMTLFVNAADAVRAAFGAALMGVHHAGKDAARGARNSSVLKAAADFEVRAESEEGSYSVTLSNTKAKDWEAFPRTRLTLDELEIADPRTGEMFRSLHVRPDGVADLPPAPDTSGKRQRLGANERLVLDVIISKGTLTFGEIKTHARIEDNGTLGRTLNTLVAKKLVNKDVGNPPLFTARETVRRWEGGENDDP